MLAIVKAVNFALTICHPFVLCQLELGPLVVGVLRQDLWLWAIKRKAGLMQPEMRRLSTSTRAKPYHQLVLRAATSVGRRPPTP